MSASQLLQTKDSNDEDMHMRTAISTYAAKNDSFMALVEDAATANAFIADKNMPD